MKKMMKFLAAVCIAATVCTPVMTVNVQAFETTAADTVNPGSWRKNNTGWWYRNADGSYPAGEAMIIGGKTYYFNNSGYMVTGWQKLDGQWYYFEASGAMVKSSWKKLSGVWYYLGEDGGMYTGLRKVGNTGYYFSSSGAMGTGWKKINNIWYWFNDSGAMATGWRKISNVWYYFDSEGKMLTGMQNIGSEIYYLRSSGAMATGWIQLNGTWYYATSSGALLKNTFQVINGSKYYFDEIGAMAVGQKEIDGKIYNFDSSGALNYGWKKSGDAYYYYNETGELYKNDWYEIENHWYYFYEDGKMAANTTIDGYKIGPTGIYLKETKDSRGITYVNGIMIANKKHALPKDYAPGENGTAGTQIRKLIADMRAKGYNISTSYSGYRSYDYQYNLYWSYVNRDGSQASADRYSARPGYSEHQTGLAFDLMHTSGSLVTGTAEANWIAANAHKYGFVVRYKPGTESITGYMAEPWHLRYVGDEAELIYRSGLTLEEYFCIEGGTSY